MQHLVEIIYGERNWKINLNWIFYLIIFGMNRKMKATQNYSLHFVN